MGPLYFRLNDRREQIRLLRILPYTYSPEIIQCTLDTRSLNDYSQQHYSARKSLPRPTSCHTVQAGKGNMMLHFRMMAFRLAARGSLLIASLVCQREIDVTSLGSRSQSSNRRTGSVFMVTTT